MPLTPKHLSDLVQHGFDEVIDVRSPSEFAEDHVPGAVNLPVLNDAERARVGTIYVREDTFLARRIGAALVARNAAAHLEGHLAGRDGRYRPLVYCWRGGQRSGSFATILSQVGWRVDTLAGGYRSWRRLVNAALHDTPFPAPVVVLDGNTGSAKTDLLHELARQGVQVLDLEGLANHRGSLFGAMPGGQPSQKLFESRMAAVLAGIDPARPVVVEAESAKVGARSVPPSLWKAMLAAPRVTIAAPRAARAAYLARAYADLAADRAGFAAVLDDLRPYQPRERVDGWHALLDAGLLELLAAELMEHHYDPRYARSRARSVGDRDRVVPAESLTPDALPDLAARIAAQVDGLTQRMTGGPSST